MGYVSLSIGLFLIGYLTNLFYITVLYHRGLTHKSVKLTSRGTKIVAMTGNWVTGIDPKAWACMHRLHHQYSDIEGDPHSPVHHGVLGVAMAQLNSYKTVLVKLIKRDPALVKIVDDLNFDVSSMNRKKMWMLPYIFHLTTSIVLALVFHHWLVGLCYYLGIMSHPVQGWMVNALAHRYGYRNFDAADNSRNNLLVAWVTFGEGYQNNHHAYPRSANFGKRWFELDPGYGLCWLGYGLGLLTFNIEEDKGLIPPNRLQP